jgi:hypothetical protein
MDLYKRVAVANSCFSAAIAISSSLFSSPKNPRHCRAPDLSSPSPDLSGGSPLRWTTAEPSPSPRQAHPLDSSLPQAAAAQLSRRRFLALLRSASTSGPRPCPSRLGVSPASPDLPEPRQPSSPSSPATTSLLVVALHSQPPAAAVSSPPATN